MHDCYSTTFTASDRYECWTTRGSELGCFIRISALCTSPFLFQDSGTFTQRLLSQLAATHKLNYCYHTAKVTTYVPRHINEVLRCQFVHRKISALTFGTNHVHDYSPSLFILTITLFPLSIIKDDLLLLSCFFKK